jgi:hypothetical protein
MQMVEKVEKVEKTEGRRTRRKMQGNAGLVGDDAMMQLREGGWGQ